MLLTVGVFLAILLGFTVTSAFLRKSARIGTHPVLQLSLSLGVGFCTAGACYFCCLLMFPYHPYVYVVLESALVAGLAFVFPPVTASHRLLKTVTEDRALGLTLIWRAAIVASCWILWSIFRQFPHGSWDAIAIWNLKARYLFAGDTVWKGRLFSQYLAHPDYPLGNPSTIASLWQFAGKDSTRVPLIVACGFAFATIGLLYSSLSLLGNRKSGILAALSLLSTPFFLLHTGSQYSDVPLSFLFLATVVLLTLHETNRGTTHHLLVFVGMLLGFAAWTKNEGLLFLVVVSALQGAVSFSRRGLRAALKELFLCGIGAVPFLLMLGYFKRYLAPANDLISGWHHVDWQGYLLDGQRHAIILKAFGHEVLQFGQWWINPVPFVILYLLVSKPNTKTNVQPGGLISGAVFVAMLAGYYIVYAIQPLDLRYLLDSSLNRLLLQLWPIFLFHVFVRRAGGEVKL